MGEPILIAGISAVSAIIGGVIGGLLRPWGQDWVARRADEREALRRRSKERVDRIQTVADLLALAGSNDPRQDSAKPKLRPAVRSVGDERLTAAVDAFCDTKRGEEYWPTLEVAQKVAGEVLWRAIKD